MLGRFADPGARLVAVAFAVGALLVIQVVVLVCGGVLAAREGDRAVDDSFAYLADVSQERVVAYARVAQNVAIENKEKTLSATLTQVDFERAKRNGQCIYIVEYDLIHDVDKA